MSGRTGMKHYDVEVKREAVRMFLEEHHTYAIIAKELGIRKAARIAVWVRMNREEGEQSFYKPIRLSLKVEAEQRELERLRMENALLKKISYQIAGSAARAAQYWAIYHHRKEYVV
jgi:transposase-like protein